MKDSKKTEQTIVLGGGCFWCLDAAYRMLKGVEAVTAGYAGGEEKPPFFVGDVHDSSPFIRVSDEPTYRQVSTGETGHVEVVQVTFDPKVLPLADLLDFFFALHDPTTRDRQGNDAGPQYRSIVLYSSPEQEREAKAAIG
ncbi:MAG: peptide-methionine (S)-S-oxide reductase MsrA, partial [Patescibacteria group bacterium]|nr:peptide-methionine (S)-S-oxide reductase MsrA [Patescibacteria group bacterium]